jgi:hypothetical protein
MTPSPKGKIITWSWVQGITTIQKDLPIPCLQQVLHILMATRHCHIVEEENTSCSCGFLQSRAGHTFSCDMSQMVAKGSMEWSDHFQSVMIA